MVALVAASMWLVPGVYAGLGVRPVPLTFIDGFCPWDCLLYANIAHDGYTSNVLVNFWPLLPMLARPLVWLHADPKIAVVVVANAAALGAFLVVYRLFDALEGAAAARWGTAAFAAYPFAFFFSAGYPESLMVIGGAGALLLAVRQRHIWAGVVLGIAALARHPTILAGLGLLTMQLQEVGGHPIKLLKRRAALGLILPIAILSLWPLYLHFHFRDALAFVHARANWGWHAWLSLPAAWKRAPESRMLLVYPFVSLIPGVGAFALLARRRWWPLAAIAVPSMLLYWSVGAFGLGRYSASTWAAFVPLGAWLARRPALQLPLLLALALLQGFWLHLFAHAYELQ
jgi:hypothetical protein